MEKQTNNKNKKQKTKNNIEKKVEKNTTKKDLNEKKAIKEETNNNRIVSKKKHNGIISFWKFMFCMMIVIYHANVFSKNHNNVLFSKGSIGVEFFFLVSGYLMTKSALKKSDDENLKLLGKDTIKFIWKKYKSFLPYTIMAGLTSLVILNIYTHVPLYNNITSIWDILLIRMTGLVGLCVNGPIWYISSMLLAMMILYPIIKKYKLNFLILVAPIILLFGFGYMSATYNNLRTPDQWLGFTYKGNMRAFLVLLLGGILYITCEKIKNINFTKFGKILLTFIELSCFVLPFLMSQFMDSATRYDFITLIVISIGVILAFSEQTLEYNIMCNKFSYWLERLSLTLYVFHFPIRLFFKNASFLKNISYMRRLLIYLPTTLIISIIIMYLIDYLKKKKFFLDKVKHLIIKIE